MSNVNIYIIQVLVSSIDTYFKVLIFTLKVKILWLKEFNFFSFSVTFTRDM